MITVTSTATKKIQANLARRGSGIGIRVAVKTTGCSGLAYVLEYVDKPNDDDIVFVSHDVSIFTTAKCLSYTEGTTMDWVKKGLNEGFDFINPKESARCGCGESFTI